MKLTRFTVEQRISILQETEAAGKVAEICRKYGISTQSIYRWKKKYGGLTVNEARRLRSLEEENQKLKNLVAEQALDIRALKGLLEKNW